MLFPDDEFIATAALLERTVLWARVGFAALKTVLLRLCRLEAPGQAALAMLHAVPRLAATKMTRRAWHAGNAICAVGVLPDRTI